MRENQLGICEHCASPFGYYLVHNGFSDSYHAYCDSCGMVAILSIFAKRGPTLPRDRDVFHEIFPEFEASLTRCECGGAFKAGSHPRCPTCMKPLSPKAATTYIEQNSSGGKNRWRWQGNWHGLYCIVIDGRVVFDNFKS